MTEMAVHTAYFLKDSIDPIVFLRLLRLVFFAISGVLMFLEPMNCGGKNRVFHRLIALLLFTGVWATWDQARSRMMLITLDPVAVAGAAASNDLFWSSLAFTLAAGAMTLRLLYDAYVTHRLKTLGCRAECGHECEPTVGRRVTDMHITAKG